MNFDYNEMDIEDIQKNLSQIKKIFRTPFYIKMIIFLFISIIPMILFWGLMGGEETTGIFFEKYSPIIHASYGIQWLTALCIWIFSFFVAFLIVKFRSDVKSDIYGGVIAIDFFITSLWLINVGMWLILVSPLMYIAGYIIGSLTRFFIFIIKQKKIFEKNIASNGLDDETRMEIFNKLTEGNIKNVEDLQKHLEKIKNKSNKKNKKENNELDEDNDDK